MSYHIDVDNSYTAGTVVSARANPTLLLKIRRYYQRIYYCTVVGDETKKEHVYFERELLPPGK